LVVVCCPRVARIAPLLRTTTMSANAQQRAGTSTAAANSKDKEPITPSSSTHADEPTTVADTSFAADELLEDSLDDLEVFEADSPSVNSSDLDADGELSYTAQMSMSNLPAILIPTEHTPAGSPRGPRVVETPFATPATPEMQHIAQLFTNLAPEHKVQMIYWLTAHMQQVKEAIDSESAAVASYMASHMSRLYAKSYSHWNELPPGMPLHLPASQLPPLLVDDIGLGTVVAATTIPTPRSRHISFCVSLCRASRARLRGTHCAASQYARALESAASWYELHQVLQELAEARGA